MENNNCIFCSKEKLNIIYEDDIFYVIRDAYPVTTDHTLIILNEHNKTYFDLLGLQGGIAASCTKGL